MKFEFRQQIQSYAAMPDNHAVGFRTASYHAASIAEAAERFIRDELVRKRAKILATFAPDAPQQTQE
jgi:hypothetical protein